MIKFGVEDGAVQIAIGVNAQPNGDVNVVVDGANLVVFTAGDAPRLVIAEKWLKEKGITVEIQTS